MHAKLELDLAEIARAGSVVVSDSVGLKTGLPWYLRPVTKHAAFCGRAVTAEVDPGDNRAAYEALALMKPGDVLVVSCAGALDVAMVGGSLTGHSHNLGAVAVVTDGLVRDTASIERLGIPVWARGLCPNAPTKLTPGRIGAPLVIGGVEIATGDIIVGDHDGVAVIPATVRSDFLDRLRRNVERERQADESVERGDVRPQWFPQPAKA